MTKPLVTALAGMTIACRDPALLADLFTAVLGWRLVAREPLPASASAAWGVPHRAGDQFIVAAAGATRGMVRIIPGDARPASPGLRARWAGVEILVARDLDALHERLVAHPGFRSTHVPFDTDWSDYGSNVHRAFVGLGEGGTHLAFTMAVTRPVGRDFPATEAGVGYVFDVPLITTRYEPVSRFYRETLGMVPFLESSFTQHHWHEIWDLPDGSPVRLDILKGDASGTGLGGIELQGYADGVVADTPARADRLDGGACLVSYSSEDVDRAYQAVAADPAATVLSAPAPLDGAPYHGARAFAFLGPDGERVEIGERLWA